MTKSAFLNTLIFALIILSLSLSFIHCSVKLMADYDEFIDMGLTELHRRTEIFLTQLETDLIRLSNIDEDSEYRQIIIDNISYEANTDFYNDFLIELRVIKLRAECYTYNELTVKQLNIMEEILKTQKSIHKRGFDSHRDINDMRSAFNRAFRGIIKLEIAKKR